MEEYKRSLGGLPMGDGEPTALADHVDAASTSRGDDVDATPASGKALDADADADADAHATATIGRVPELKKKKKHHHHKRSKRESDGDDE